MILIDGSFNQSGAMANTLQRAGLQVAFWDKRILPTLDAFNQLNPNIALVDFTTVDRALEKALAEHECRLFVRLGDCWRLTSSQLKLLQERLDKGKVTVWANDPNVWGYERLKPFIKIIPNALDHTQISLDHINPPAISAKVPTCYVGDFSMLWAKSYEKHLRRRDDVAIYGANWTGWTQAVGQISPGGLYPTLQRHNSFIPVFGEPNDLPYLAVFLGLDLDLRDRDELLYLRTVLDRSDVLTEHTYAHRLCELLPEYRTQLLGTI